MDILVADNDEFVIQVLDLYVKNQLGHRIFGANTGAKSLEIINDHDFDLVITDIHLPDMSGYDLLKEIRKTRSHMELPVMLVTTNTDSQDIVKGFNLGANEYITKPLEPQIVLVRIQNILNARKEYLNIKPGGKKVDSEKIAESQLLASASTKDYKSDIANIFQSSISMDYFIPCEMPIIVTASQRNYFCKTLKIGLHKIGIMAFDEIPGEPSYTVNLVHPNGDLVNIEVVETHRVDEEDRSVGRLKLILKIITGSKLYDEFYSQLHHAFKVKGVAGLKSVLQGSTTMRIAGGAGEETEDLHRGDGSSLKVIEGYRYRFERLLGVGGFASVYLVEDLALKRLVAMKVLTPSLALDQTARTNFLTEAQIAAQFHHPNIVFVYEVGEYLAGESRRYLDFPENLFRRHNERFIYFTMQYIEGKSLLETLKIHSSLPEYQCINIMTETCKALSYAHEKNVTHRDIKPANIMITPENQIIVTDFGIAKVTKVTDKDGDIAEYTHQGKLECTPRYASPEQLLSEKIDPRSDIYSLGVTIYESLAGTPPFADKEVYALVKKQVYDRPEPLNSHLPEIDKRLEALVLKCMEKKPQDRFADARELVTVLEKIKGPEGGKESSQEMTLRSLLNQILMLDDESDALVPLIKLTTLLSMYNASDVTGDLDEVKAQVSEPTIINTFLKKNLRSENFEHLYKFFKELESGKAVYTLLRWFQKERDATKKVFLARMAVISSQRNTLPLVVFGLELGDKDAVFLLKGFREEGALTESTIILKWAEHPGLKTQLELLEVLAARIHKAKELELSVVRAMADGYATSHRAVREQAAAILPKANRR